jgi:hypothetical protein
MHVFSDFLSLMETWVLNGDVMWVYVAGGDGPVLSLVVFLSVVLQGDYKLLSGFPWPIIFKPKTTK